MFALLFALLIHGHHYGWQQPHNPHHRPAGCSIVLINCPPTHIDWTGRTPAFPGLP